MRKLIYAINLTLDGYTDHEAGIADDELHDFFTNLLRESGLLIYGRVTYELMASYWPLAPDLPNSTASEIEFAHVINRMPKIVVSKTLEKAEWNNSRILRDHVVEEVLELKKQPGKDIAVGGLSLASYLVDRGLVDEYWLVVHPVLLGKGKPVIKGLHNRIVLQLLEAKPFKSGVIALHYQAMNG